MKIKSLGFKVSLIVAVLIVAIIAVVAYIVSVQSDDLVLSLAMKEARASNLALAKELQSLQRDAQARADSISRSYEVITAIQENDMGTLKSALDLLGDDMDVITVCDTKGTVILRAHSDAKGDNVAHLQEIEVALRTGTGMGTIGKGTVANLETSGSAAVTDFSGKIIGVVSCGHDLSNFSYVDDIKDYSSCEATIFDGDMRLSTTLIDEKGNRVIGTRASDYVVETVIRQRNDYSLQIMLFGKYYFAYYSPLVVDNEVIGMLFTGVEIDDALASQHTMLNAVLMTSAICGVLGIALVFVFNTYAVSRPLKRIGSFAEKIRTGDLGIASSSASTIEVHSVDEVGVLARTLEQAYMQLRGYVGEISDRMHDLADGDLATESEYVFDGDFLQIKEAINGIIHNLNQTMTEVNNASFQVSSGSKQVADGAQSLAQGSTEQAASIQELSASIADIAEKTKANADMAVNASKLSDTIRSDAEAGSQQMDDMIAAVREINEASQSIGRIIKTIDDIAFQTNILALNAAVEAARAGEHGKGFAVVAEEVRNLASKSAEAAKDTGDMIQNSMEKAELGSRIAEDTAASLNKIATGINESTQLINEIAGASEEQSLGIAQINIGIDQVAQVVSQNSATAEESAAASEEMSSQSSILQDLIARFKLRQDSPAPSGLSGLSGISGVSAIAGDWMGQASEETEYGFGGSSAAGGSFSGSGSISSDGSFGGISAAGSSFGGSSAAGSSIAGGGGDYAGGGSDYASGADSSSDYTLSPYVNESYMKEDYNDKY